ncbi:MAG TPA: heme-binding domain-containing protein [Opitutaceae bacterium]|nr:heme-binding domain-containing protein [Opitutaceae bacterium]
MLKKILLVLGLLFIGIQFVRPARNLSSAPNPNDLIALHPTPPAVKQLLSVACYDCHSNTTRYPWYAEIQPMGWWLASHVSDGKAELNFSDFGTYPAKKAARVLEVAIDEIDGRKMPLPSYRLTHGDARLSDAQIKLLSDWFDETRERILEDAPAAGAAAP